MAEDTGQRTPAEPGTVTAHDGQHRESGSGAPGDGCGQVSRVHPGAYVGNRSGGEQQMNVPASHHDADTEGEAENMNAREEKD